MNGETRNVGPVDKGAPGASLFVPFTLNPGETKIIRLMMAWYVPETNLKYGKDPKRKNAKMYLIPIVPVNFLIINHGIQQNLRGLMKS